MYREPLKILIIPKILISLQLEVVPRVDGTAPEQRTLPIPKPKTPATAATRSPTKNIKEVKE
jgi:hypothetical protein